MLPQKINVAPVKINYAAFSLLEVLIATTLGAFLLFLFTSYYVDFSRTQTKQKELLSLQAEAHQLLNYFQQHFQQMGYQGVSRADSNFALFQLDGKSINIPNQNCLIGFYDLNQDGCLGKRKTKTTACQLGETNNSKEVLKEIFGFKVENKEIYAFSTNLDNCIGEQCRELLKHCNGTWSKFTDSNNFKVDKLNFSWKKENSVLKFELELSSGKNDNVAYSANSYIYLLNQ